MPFQGKLRKKGNMATLNLGTGEQRQNILKEQGKINHFRDQKAENKLGSNFGKKGTQPNF